MKFILEVLHIIGLRTIGAQLLTDRLKLNAILTQQTFILLESINKIFLLKSLFPSSGRLRRHDAALHLGLDAVCAGFVLITTNLALLTQDTAGPPRELHSRGVVILLLLLLLLSLLWLL